MYLGASIFPTTAGADVVTGITGAISDNIGTVLVVLAAVVGIRVALKLFNSSLKGKARV